MSPTLQMLKCKQPHLKKKLPAIPTSKQHFWHLSNIFAWPCHLRLQTCGTTRERSIPFSGSVYFSLFLRLIHTASKRLHLRSLWNLSGGCSSSLQVCFKWSPSTWISTEKWESSWHHPRPAIQTTSDSKNSWFSMVSRVRLLLFPHCSERSAFD